MATPSLDAAKRRLAEVLNRVEATTARVAAEGMFYTDTENRQFEAVFQEHRQYGESALSYSSMWHSEDKIAFLNCARRINQLRNYEGDLGHSEGRCLNNAIRTYRTILNHTTSISNMMVLRMMLNSLSNAIDQAEGRGVSPSNNGIDSQKAALFMGHGL